MSSAAISLREIKGDLTNTLEAELNKHGIEYKGEVRERFSIFKRAIRAVGSEVGRAALNAWNSFVKVLRDEVATMFGKVLAWLLVAAIAFWILLKVIKYFILSPAAWQLVWAAI